MQNHEYSLLGGMNRATVGRYLTLIATTVSAGIVFVILSAVDLAARYGWNAKLAPSIMSFVSAATVFAALYWIFNRFAWRWPLLNLVVKVPDLAGKWKVVGRTLDAQGTGPATEWAATITIVQSWDKIRVRLKTDQSTSDSISAALIADDAEGYRLFYNYRNTPKIGEVALSGHLGFCELLFAKSLETGEGEYFNGHGRYTFGTMKLEKDSNGA